MQKQILIIGLILASLNLWAQNEPKQVTSTFALQNVTVVQAPGKVMENATVVVKDGLIQAVGKNVTIPFDAKVVKADSMYVYAGFIDGASHVGIPKVEEKNEGGRRNRSDIKNPGNPPNEKAGIQPERQAREVIKASEKSIEDMRKLGFTTAHVVPDGKMLPGKGAIILLAGESVNDMVLMENTAMFAQFKGAGGVFPNTVIAVMSKFRELYKQAEQAKAHEATFTKSPSGIKRPTSDPVLEAFYPVLEGKQSVFMKANNRKDLSRALVLQKELGYNLTLVEVQQGWQYGEQLKEIPVFLSLELPKKPKETKKKDEEEESKEKSPEEKEMETLEKRRMEEMKKHEAQAATLTKMGINFGFSTLDAKTKDIKETLMRMIEAGLTEDQALAALTTTPAKMLGINKVTGTVEKGKIANLVVTDASYFDKESNVRYVFVDGQLFEYEAKAKKKKKKEGSGEATENADVVGVWTYELSVPQQEMEGTFTFKVDGDEVTGSMSDPQGEDDDEELKDVELDGDTMTFSMTIDQGGSSITVEFTLEFDGEAYEGTFSVGEFGTFDVEGARASKPE